MIWGSGGSKSRLAKAAGAEPAGQMRDEKLHAVVARSTFPSQNVQDTPCTDHFWRFRCRKSARCCGANAHFQVKMYKTLGVRTTFGSWDVKKVHAVVARSTFRSQNVQNTPCTDHFWRFRCRKSARRCGEKHISKSKCAKSRGSDHFWDSDFASLRVTTLHYTLHYTTVHYTTLHSTTQQLQLQNYTTTLHYTPLHAATLHYTKLHTLHHITLHSTTLHYITVHYTLHYTTVHYTTLYNPLHYSTLHYTTLHYTTVHYTNVGSWLVARVAIVAIFPNYSETHVLFEGMFFFWEEKFSFSTLKRVQI